MKSGNRIAGFSGAELNRLHDEARQRAVTLRDQAIDEFWCGVNVTLWAQLSSARCAATRLSQRLRHHQQLRSTASR